MSKIRISNIYTGPIDPWGRPFVKLTKAQEKELKKVNKERVVRVWKDDKALKIYRALEEKRLIEVAWSFPNAIDFKIPGIDTRGMY